MNQTYQKGFALLKKTVLTVGIIFLSFAAVTAQQRTVTGKVVDESNQPLIGATVVVEGAGTGFVTDGKGSYTLTVSGPEAVLVANFLGYESVLEQVGSRTTIDFTLRQTIQQVDEVVVVGYGTQTRSSLTSAISTVNAADLVNAPVQNISNAMQGRVTGLIMTQNSGKPGADGANINIRGIGTIGNNSPLCIVDGVPRDFNRLDPNSIESISILKDAAAVAPYGMAGANGVVLVTTKQGKTGAPVIQYSGYYGFQNPTHMHKMASSYETAIARNWAATNSGLTEPYSTETLANLKLASEGKSPDPDLWSSTNFFKEVFARNTPMTGHNISIAGGSERITFYTGLGYKYQKGMTDPVSNNRYSITQNLKAKVNNTLEAGVNLNLIVDKTSSQQMNDWNIYETGFQWDPAMPLYYSNGGQAATLEKGVTPYSVGNGYIKNDIYQIFTQVFLEQQLPFVPGLSAKFVFSYDPTFIMNSNWKVNGGDYYRIDNSVSQKAFNLVEDKNLSSLSESINLNQNYTYQGILNYKRSFGKHDLSGVFVYEYRNGKGYNLAASRSNYLIDVPVINMGSGAQVDWGNSGSRSKSKQLGAVIRLAYAYDSKYMLEVAGRRDGHYYFAPSERFGIFPSVSAAWRLSQEKFIRESAAAEIIDNLKIRASWGQSGGMPNANAFQYLQYYTINQMAYPWGSDTGIGFNEGTQANPFITWEKSNQTDIGFDVSLWNGLLSLEFDWYYQKRSDMLASPAITVPGEYGIGLAQVNAAKMHNTGIEINLGSRKRFENGLQLYGNLTFTYSKDVVDENFENSSTYDNPRRRRTGHSLDAFMNGRAWGYEAVRLYTEDDLVKQADGTWLRKDGVKVPYSISPGDIMYKDQDGDGEITPEGDEICIMNQIRPQVLYGLNLGASWKGFDVSILFQGAAKTKNYLQDDLVMPFTAGALGMVKPATDYWTPDNTGARFPKLYNGGQSSNNSVNSSWYVVNASYCRIKNVEIGYTLPKKISEKIRIGDIRIYVSGQNLFTFAGEIKKYIDPEIFTSDQTNSRGYYYPQQRVISTGINITF